ncbi:MAG: diguanylate cyclase [Hydrogenovibrio sp.]|nr:diguanylate cyclase [Hydrogenovibrio sp.]
MGLETELLQDIVTALPDPVFILTESGRYLDIFGGHNPEYYHDGSPLVGLSLFDVMPEEKARWFLNEIRLTLAQNQLRTVEYGLSAEDVDGLDTDTGPRGEIWFEGRIQPLSQPYKGEKAVVWVARNITRRYQLEAELRRISETDALTGIYNRRKFLLQLEERFNEFKRYPQSIAMIMFDIDFFKSVNDRFGHKVGDEVLCYLGQTCLTQLREVDHLYRIGGEEFAILLPNTDLDAATGVAERLRQTIADCIIPHQKGELNITISLGISTLLDPDTSIEEVIQRTDDALYKAKDKGRNSVVVCPQAKSAHRKSQFNIV